MSESKPTSTDETRSGTASANEDINVQIEDVTKVFQNDEGNDIVAVEDLDIDIRRGEFLVFVGPSGCGKTTSLRMVAGLETPTEGKIRIEDEDVTGYDPRERGIAMVFQNYALYPHMTVAENMSFPLRIRNYPSDEIDDRVDEAAELLEIDDLLDRKPSQLSGGQQQRVALGRAIVREPSVFLMDEPLSNLDAKLRVQMRTELNEIHQRVGKTTIYVTHDQAEAMTLGDRVAVLNDGTLQQIGPPQYLYDNPVNRFVAGFIGEPPMNFLPVSIRETNDGYDAVGEFFEFELPRDVVRDIDEWDGSLDHVTLGVRPEDLSNLSVLDHDEYTENSTLDASVKVVEPMGSDKFLTLTSPTDDTTEFSARVSPESTVAPGESISLAANLEKIHLFDERTGENITY
ncbi:multiple sugar transport system ATP-binding protein [Halopelagius inordinatus]|uniref:ABC-type D-xylose/L-arabinose transporter n=1 Tax=Halopelagius inordinatus TaxID=553467 RepID=A0A1I2V9R7_9EURY|nr:ABC transporter ATP-binding protein [Halopelagius inordinatus]SFG85962.1 multiple sugar transport system ATP-binding protein [Halopelagius inordinatus]